MLNFKVTLFASITTLGSLVGCLPEGECPPGYERRDRACIGLNPDSGSDAGSDAATLSCSVCEAPTPVCETSSGQCVECLSDSNCVPCPNCPANFCTPDHTCSELPRDSVGVCELCYRSEHCENGYVCVPERLARSDVFRNEQLFTGNRCVPRVNAERSCSTPGFTRPMTTVTTDGSVVQVCMPAMGNSCLALIDAGRGSLRGDDQVWHWETTTCEDLECGHPESNDSVCMDSTTAFPGICSVRCQGDLDCPSFEGSIGFRCSEGLCFHRCQPGSVPCPANFACSGALLCVPFT